ncbi:MAG: PfkB domain protein [Thermotoga sp. 50_1627]|nr:MAG: PfkB domain protein [Thermotoga sp. 50_64]KUK25111.1 MAG: PfkB domain protein [Thermotoga sp. 50_1627]MBC7121760.1 ribokinase [Pseudothermotoga sp.]HBT39460.1 ribokinase [Pseudothermotoga sp.]HCO97127.1 ribokinase [Pseudothermotoga sp.]
MGLGIQILNLNPCYDHWVIISNVPKTPNVLRGDYVVKLVDGKGLNIARVFNRLGFQDYLCINVLGGDVGKIISSKCREEGIRTAEFWINDENRINTAIVYEYEKRMLMVNEPGPIITEDEIERLIQYLESIVEERSTLVISGSAPRGFTAEDMAKIAQMAMKKGCRLMIDISGEWLRKLVDFAPEMVKVNGDELKTALDLYDLSVTKLFEIKQRYMINVLCVTFGKEGSITLTENRVFHARPKLVHSDFSVGSGDSFFAGYLYEEAMGKSMEERLIFATACGMANTLKYGAAIFDLNDLYEQLPLVELVEERL